MNLQIATSAYLVLLSVSTLILISIGLAIIFGLMGVINLAHGEFMMLGAYACVFLTSHGFALWAGFLFAMICVGLFGVIVERFIIRHLYGRLIDTLLATWGLSLCMSGGAVTLFGPQSYGLPVDFGNVQIGGTSLGTYNLLLSAIALAMLFAVWLLLRFTRFGLIVRGTMQDATMASAMGVNKGMVYTSTFGIGSALAGLAGAVVVPLTGVSPILGVSFVTKAFITVIAGGHLPLLGTIGASGLFGSIEGVLSYIFKPVYGEVGALVVAVVLLRLLPTGITGRLRNGI